MQYKLHHLLAASLLCIGSLKAGAQTTSNFEDVTLGGADTGYLETKYPVSGSYTFQSGNAKFYGSVMGSSWSDFNVSNATDTMRTSYTKAAVAIPGKGYNNTTNYAIAYVPIDFMGPVTSATIPVGAKLQGAAAGHKVFGAYFTNSVYAYRYILNGGFYANNHHWLKLIVRGYLAGVKSTDSVSVTLADYTNTASPVLVNNWKWTDLTSLGNVDSLTFDLISSDADPTWGINTPAYFAMDNLITSDGKCPAALDLAVSGITVSGAQLNWSNSMTEVTPGYQVAVDQSATLAHTAATTNVTATTYAATNLNSNATYYAHIRAACGDGSFSDWDTAMFKTLPGTGIFQTPDNSLTASISPNPVKDVLHINAQTTVDAVIYSIEGRRVMTVKAAKEINITELNEGLYFIKLTESNGNRSGTLRFAKTN